MVHNLLGRCEGALLDDVVVSPSCNKLRGKAPANRLEGAEGKGAEENPPDRRLCGGDSGAEESEVLYDVDAIDDGLGSLAGMMIVQERDNWRER
jgi:hypothetical protein